MKTKIILIIGVIYLAIAFASAQSYDLTTQVLADEAGSLMYSSNINSFLSGLLQGGNVKSQLVYDSRLDSDIISILADYFSIDNITIATGSSLQMPNRKRIFIGLNDSMFINQSIRGYSNLESADAFLLFDEPIFEQGNLYIILARPAVLINVSADLEFFFLFETLNNNFAYYNSTGFFSPPSVACSESAETDLGDSPNVYGCLNNGVNWTCDFCVDNSILAEFTCLNKSATVISHSCNQSGKTCRNGECITCTKGYISEFKCEKNYLYQGYQSANKNACKISWKSLKKFRTATECQGALKTPGLYAKKTITGQVTAESNYNIFSKIKKFLSDIGIFG